MTASPRVLSLAVVDDDEQIRRAVERFLRSHGHGVQTFDSAEAFLARTCQADCAILDIRLPGMSGLELAARITGEGTRMPIVFITAQDETDLLAAVKETDRPLLRKPIDGDDLLEAIARAVSRQP